MSHERLRPEYLFDQDRVDALREIAPEAFADGKINWSTLKEALGTQIEDDEADAEHFGLNWPGKSEARRFASIPSVGTLVPAKGEGINEDSTGNIFIEGENLEVLKILRKSYSGRIKMIYIDPPYNTGNDFVYDDDFTEPLQDYLKRTGQIDGEGRPMTTNKKADGRFHSKWLSMMYPRLRLARELLRDDGVIFISIDDNEDSHLRMLMNEVFGEENFVSKLVWNTEGHSDNQFDVKINHEYVLMYCKSNVEMSVGYVIDPNTRAESNLWKGIAENSITKNGPKNPPSIIELPAGFPCVAKNLTLPPHDLPQSFYSEVSAAKYIPRQLSKTHNVAYPIRKDEMKVEGGRLTKPCHVFSGWANADKLRRYISGAFQPIEEADGTVEFFLSENGVIYYRKHREQARNILSVIREQGTTERMRSELESEYGIPFQYPKPKELLSYLIDIGAPEGIVLDFFAGSATTAHAIIENNSRQDLKYILVQLPESLNGDSPNQVAARDFCLSNNLQPTIAEIAKERIRRVIKRRQQDLISHDSTPSIGVKVFRLGASHFMQWQNYNGTSVEDLESLFEDHTSPLVDDWKSIDDGLFTEVLLLEGFPLDSTVILFSEYTSNQIRRVECPFHENRLLICLDEQIQRDTIDNLDLSENDTFICLDSAIDDQTKTIFADKGLIKTI